MSNNINVLISSAQEIVKNIYIPLQSSKNEEEKKVILEEAAQKISFLFKNRDIALPSKEGLSLEQQAVSYVHDYPVLSFFLSQLFPGIQFPKVTQNEDQNFEIAKVFVTSNLNKLSEFIQSYGLTQEQIFKIVKIVAVKDPAHLSKFIQKYRLTQEQNFEIAKIAVVKNVRQVSRSIENYGLTQEQNFEIAKRAVTYDAIQLSQFIENYELTQDQNFEIAKVVAAQDIVQLSQFIQNYNLSPTQSFEFAIACAAQDANKLCRYINNFGLQDKMQLFKVFITSLSQTSEVISRFAKYPLSAKEHLLFKSFHLLAETNPGISLVIDALQTFAKEKSWIIEPLTKGICQLTDTKIQKESLIWLTHLLSSSLLENLSGTEFNVLFTQGLINNILFLRDPALRYLLTAAMVQYAKNSIAQKFFQECAAVKNFHDYQRLPVLLISLLFSREVSESVCQQLVEISHNRNFKNQISLRKWLKTLDCFFKETELTSEDKEYLLVKLINESKKSVFGKGNKTQKQQIEIPLLLERFGTAVNIFNFKKEIQCLKKQALAQNGDLSSVFQNIFTKHLPIKPFEDFSKLYIKHFADSRVPHYILTYISKIQFAATDERKVLIDTLALCVEAILEGKSKDYRYDEDKSQHLQTVFSERKELLEEWKRGKVQFLNDFLLQMKSAKEEKQDLIAGLQKYDHWTIEDTDNEEDLFLCATEVESCQAITRNIKNNKCLMAYFLDGKNRLLAIKDASGRIRARCIFRILWDGEKPVLFLERMYPDSAILSLDLKDALVVFARQRAKTMQLDLLSKEYKSDSVYPKSIQSLGSRAPFEYSDSAEGDGVFKEGRYEIQGAKYIEKLN